MRDIKAKSPTLFKMQLAGQDGLASVELVRFFGLTASFYSVRAPLPLGLKLTKRESGKLQGAFVVEDVVAGGSAEASGKILAGDVLQALTIVSGSAGLGSRGSEYQEFLSTMLGSIDKPQQSLVDASFINTLDDLVEAIKTNLALGDGTELTLIFERDTSERPVPDEPLQSVAA